MKVARKLRKLPVGGSHTVLSKEGHTLLVIAIKKIPGSLISGIPSIYIDLCCLFTRMQAVVLLPKLQLTGESALLLFNTTYTTRSTDRHAR